MYTRSAYPPKWGGGGGGGERRGNDQQPLLSTSVIIPNKITLYQKHYDIISLFCAFVFLLRAE